MWTVFSLVASAGTSAPCVNTLSRALVPRPALSGPVERRDVDGYRVWFTRTGVDAPPVDDQDDNSLPDLVDVLLDALPRAEADYAAAGWRALVPDSGEGGSAAIDVYVRDIDIYGYAHTTPARDGTHSCFLEIDRGSTVAGRVAESVAFHELHHCVQFRYTAERAPWIYEAAATYEQYSRVNDLVLDLAAGVLYLERLAHPDWRLANLNGRFEYGGFLWMKFWAERGHLDASRLPGLWEDLADSDWVTALDTSASRDFGRSLADTFLEHAVWNTFACARDDGRHYRTDPIPCRATVSSPVSAWDGSPIDLVHDDGPFTASTLELAVDVPRMAVRCEGDAGMRAALVAVGSDGIGQTVSQGASGDVLEVDTTPGGTLRLVVVGTDAPLEATCERTAPRLSVPFGCRHTAASPWAGVLGLLAVARRRR